MRKIFKQIICVLVILIAGLCVLCACDNTEDLNEFDAIILDRANVLIKKEFLQSTPSYGGEFGEDTILTIKNQEQFNETFIGFPTSLDFDKEQLILCVFSDVNNGFPCGIKNIREENDVLKISLYSDLPEDDRGTPPCASSPTQRAVVIKMQKTNSSSVELMWVSKN